MKATLTRSKPNGSKNNKTTPRSTRTKPAELPRFKVATGILDEFNLDVPDCFPERSLSARAAQNIVNSEAWTDASPMLVD